MAYFMLNLTNKERNDSVELNKSDSPIRKMVIRAYLTFFTSIR